jgi:hypothetical protein
MKQKILAVAVLTLFLVVTQQIVILISWAFPLSRQMFVECK